MAAISRDAWRVKGRRASLPAAPPRPARASHHKRSYPETPRGRRRNEAAHNVLWCGGPCSSSVSRRGARDPWAVCPGGPSREAKVGGGVVWGSIEGEPTFSLPCLLLPSPCLPEALHPAASLVSLATPCPTPSPPFPSLCLPLLLPLPVQRLYNY